MSTNSLLRKAVGNWKGESKLHLSWLEDESKRIQPGPSGLHIDLDEAKSFATVTYWWTYEGKKQEGVMLIACDENRKKCFIGWVDMWHSSQDVMRFVGDLEGDKISGFGNYYAGEGEKDWGWRIGFEMKGSDLVMSMDNVTPDGESVWAVEAVYSKE